VAANNVDDHGDRPFAPFIKEHPKINWAEILRDAEHWGDGFLTGVATASLIAMTVFGIVLLARGV
jgi:hypothetical protein